jgi:futalosine hydrolase
MAANADICGMHLLLTAAVAAEIQPTLDWLAKKDSPFHDIEPLITGIGLAAATYSLAKAIQQKKPSLVIQAGIGGSFVPANSAQVFVVSDDSFGDLGVWENGQFKTIFDLKLVDENKFPYTGGTLKNPYIKLMGLTGLKTAKATTVNEITTNSRMIEWHNQTLSTVVESMEGAALHYVCLQENIPFLQIRCVSNEIGERDKTKWKMAEAISNLNEQLISLINKLSAYDETYFGI